MQTSVAETRISLYEASLAYDGIEARYCNLNPEMNWEVDLDHFETIENKNTIAMVLVNPNNLYSVVSSHKHLAKVICTNGIVCNCYSWVSHSIAQSSL
jgi:aspartate/methionine/tyrosine aminotransferase